MIRNLSKRGLLAYKNRFGEPCKPNGRRCDGRYDCDEFACATVIVSLLG